MFVVVENLIRQTTYFYYERGFFIREDMKSRDGTLISMYSGKDIFSPNDITFRLVVPGDTLTYCSGQEIIKKYFVELI